MYPYFGGVTVACARELAKCLVHKPVVSAAECAVKYSGIFAQGIFFFWLVEDMLCDSVTVVYFAVGIAFRLFSSPLQADGDTISVRKRCGTHAGLTPSCICFVS